MTSSNTASVDQSSDSEYVILQRNPSPQDYYDLRKLANLTPPPMESVPRSLANSWVFFVAFARSEMENETVPSEGQHAVAMGRLIGDGALFLQLVDVAVHPDYQRKGLGKRIMSLLVDYVDVHAPDAYVSLVADPLGQGLYPQFGFEDVKPGIGMFRCPRIQNDRAFKSQREEKIKVAMRGGSALQDTQ